MEDAPPSLHELVQQIARTATMQSEQSRQNRALIVALMQEVDRLAPGAFDRIIAAMEAETGPLEAIEHPE